MRAFKFPSLAATNVVQKQGDITVTLEVDRGRRAGLEGERWPSPIPKGGPAFESYRQGLFNNRLWLQKPDGSRFDQNGGFNNTGSDNGHDHGSNTCSSTPRASPSDHGLVYETPVKVVPIPLEFEFKNVPLP